ncbi:protein HEXIM-like [Mizuhopecten yessoensis]|uniref:Protein HEXIM n=1 Tax=Mizuhopecten yessoensis TaxID=6573 RepID=A0A210QIR9_MIZYE|nr:protein HEXIM-like [Mizuhopecten yessoensis]OWF48675.1 Protein HEXIM [Mizuhopecten yessoensis]
MSANVSSTVMMVVDSIRGESNFTRKSNTLGELHRSNDEIETSENFDRCPISPSGPLAIRHESEAQEGSESENQYDGNGKKKRRRRMKGGKHHRKWKPYDKLSWNERRELEERETVRANQKREEAFAHGHPVAPYNTTQFLMEDHIKNESLNSPYVQEDEEEHLSRHDSRESRSGSRSSDYSDETTSTSSEDEDHFMEKEFSETYDNIHAERLQMMSKDELIKDYVEMEAKLERLEKRYKNKRQKRESKNNSSASLSSEGEESVDLEAARKFEDENKLLKDENCKLKNELTKIMH